MDNYKGHSFSKETYGNHEVKVKLQWGNYKGELICSYGGNTSGSSIISGVAESFEMGNMSIKICEENRKYIIEYLDERFPHSEVSGLRLFNEEGESIEIPQYQMGKALVGVEILEFTEEDITI